MTETSTPFSHGAVSLGLYLHPEDADLRIVRRQARLAVESGFAGVSLAEHHNQRAGYVASPVLVTAALLGELPAAGWVAAAPAIIGLRPVRILAEDLMWVQAMFPGRVGLAVGAGFDQDDFDITGQPFEGRLGRFRTEIAELASARTEQAPLSGAAVSDVPVLVATRGLRNAAAAARSGLGLLLPPLPPIAAAAISGAYREAGGTGPVALGRWAWLGEPPLAAVAALNGAIAATSGDLSWRDADSVISVDAADSPAALASFLVAQVTQSGATHLHLRIHLPGLAPETVEEQIGRIGREVLPAIRAALRDAEAR